MRKPEIARLLALEAGISKAAAADELDRVVHRILVNFRQGKRTPLPGLGVFTTGPDGALTFQPAKDHPDGHR